MKDIFSTNPHMTIGVLSIVLFAGLFVALVKKFNLENCKQCREYIAMTLSSATFLGAILFAICIILDKGGNMSFVVQEQWLMFAGLVCGIVFFATVIRFVCHVRKHKPTS